MRVRNQRACLWVLAAVLLLALWPGVSFAQSQAETAGEQDYIIKYNDDDSVPFDVVSESEMEKLEREGRLEWAEPDGYAILLEEGLSGTLSPYYDDDLWNLALVKAEGALGRGYTGQGVRIGVIDSGINAHADLEGNLQEGQNYDEKGGDTLDHYGHGTQVAGIIAGASTGIARSAEVVPIKITDGKVVTISSLCLGIYGAIDDYDCDILNLSLGMTKEYKCLKEAVDYAEANNVIVVSAAGNTGSAALYYPACYESVLGVGSVDRSGSWYARSNHNVSVFLTAPGVTVKSTGYLGGYVTGTGTSFSVPAVAAAAAVLRSIDPSLRAADIRDILLETAQDRGDPGYDPYYGYGILDIQAAVTALAGEQPETQERCTFLPENGPAEQVRNNTEEELTCTYLLAAYEEDGSLQQVTAQTLTVPPGNIVDIPPPEGEGTFGQFLCRSEDMTPLTPARKTP